jgi:hypothetical protein
MIDRRDMLKLVAVGVVGAVVAGGLVHSGNVISSKEEALRFSVEGDMGVVQATSAGESIRVSGQFAERTVFTLG